jgi:recombinational DNA repair protein (RecF pathway)
MALRETEAIVLRTYPLREADLLVTLFTRAEGKVRGVARSAKKSKRRFGGALEPLTYVRAFYDVRERQELARLDSCEVLESPLASEVSYARAVALGHIAELLDELLPDREARPGHLDAGDLLRIVADAAGRFFAGVDGVYRLRSQPERQPRVLSRARGWAHVRGR